MTNLRDPFETQISHMLRNTLLEAQISHMLRNISVTWCQIGHIFSGNLGAKLHWSATTAQSSSNMSFDYY